MPPSTSQPKSLCELRCLGPVQLTGRDRRSVPLRTRKQLALLLYLARRPGRPVGRDELIELLWSADAERPARHSLSQSASLINKSLHAEVIVTAGREQLVVAPGAVWLDVAEFERQVTDGRRAEALALWRGPLLEGTWVQRAPNFERWLHEERDRLQRIFRRVAHARLEELRTGGKHATMRDEAERLLQLDPLDEKAMLVHLEALTLLDDRSLALRRYGEFEKRLRKELRAEPGSALRTWAKRHRRGDGGGTARHKVPLMRVSEVMVLPTPQPLFGRAEEFALLWDAWEQAKVGKGSFIIVEGEAGIGKTALATKLVNQAHVAGGSVCFVKCYRTEKSVPFAPVTSLIRQLGRLPGFVGLDPVWIGELTRLVPELRDRYPNAPMPMAVDDAARHRLSDATVQAALAVADELPLMIVVDDLQDADEASLAVLHYAARQLKSQAVSLVGLRRLGRESSELERAFHDSIRAHELARTLLLPALPSSDLQRLVQHVLAGNGRSAHEEMLARIVADSTGNPLQAIEAAVASLLGGSSPRPTPIPFETTAGERAGDLTAEALDVAGAIAIAGRPLSQYELSAITRLPVAELALAIIELETQQLCRRVGDQLSLAHDRYTQTVESRLTQDKQRTLHARTAVMLQQSAASDPALHYEAARHFLAAGRNTAAKQQALDAARFALSLGAARERAAALKLAFNASESFDAELAADLGACQLELREFEGLESVCITADQQQMSDERKADFSYLRTASDYFAGRASHPALVVRLQDLLSAHPAFRFGIAARTLLMRLACRSGDRTLGLRASRELRRASPGQDAENNRHAFSALAYVASKYYSPQRAISMLRRSLESAKENSDLGLEHLCRTGLCAVYRQTGEYAHSVAEAELATAFARRILNSQAEASNIMDGALAEMALGNYAKSRELFVTAIGILEDYPDPYGLSAAFSNLGELHLVSGHIDEAEQAFAKALELARPLEAMMPLLQASAGMAMCAQRQGRSADLSHWCDELRAVGQGRERVFHDRWLTEAAIAWNTATNGKGFEAADVELSAALRDLRRRDVDHWLALGLEKLTIQQRFLGEIQSNDYLVIERGAIQYGAKGILRGLTAARHPMN